MTALSKSRTVRSIPGILFSYPVLADAVIHQGAIVVVNSSGYAKPAVTGTGLVAVGIARESVDATGLSSGDISIEIEEMIAECFNSAGGDEITIADIGKVCFLADDQTVAKTSNGGARSPAGIVRQIESGKVFVELSSAIADKAENLVTLDLEVGTLVGSNVYRVVSPVAGVITKIWSVTNGVLTTGDATLTAKIGATGVTGGVITITQSGSAAGDVDSATPTAARTLAVGDVLSVTVGGTNATATAAHVSFRIET